MLTRAVEAGVALKISRSGVCPVDIKRGFCFGDNGRVRAKIRVFIDSIA